ncbi:MAG: hypothetical protein KME15_06910 [Drouetiella hepatica Uher 2000/2452]|uniref:HEAT repeat domain-containing protein n=1 Tax=Drouetiella hepatica Uher 2000/2452 TaxID=904376 RepID=A0A951UL66_9CYAN|nr:hypothetical protein [Drouetiella hepatica Uher 2000/2452]
MFHCLRLLLAAYVTCLSIASVPSQPLSHAAIAETQTGTRTERPVEPVGSSDWIGWLWALVPLTVAGSVIFAVKSQGSKKTEVDRTLPDPKHDTSDLVLLNESALPDKTREASSAAMSETTRLAKADIVETLITDLHSQDADKRRQGIWELGQRGDSRAIQPLVDLLMDSDSRQRSLILAAVSEIAVRSLKPMNRALMFSLQDESPDVRKNAIRDVTRIYDAMAQMSQLLHYAASDTDIEVQDTAHWALSQMNRMRSLPESEALSSSSEGKFKEQLSSEKMLEDQKPRE